MAENNGNNGRILNKHILDSVVSLEKTVGKTLQEIKDNRNDIEAIKDAKLPKRIEKLETWQTRVKAISSLLVAIPPTGWLLLQIYKNI